MHKSRLAAVVLDCPGDDFERDVASWGEALGRPVQPLRDRRDPRYRDLATPADFPKLLEGLGAKRIAQVKTWT